LPLNLYAKPPLASESPIYSASLRHHAADLPSELLLQRRSPGHELEVESIVDHCKAAGGKCDALAVDARDMLVFGGWAMSKPRFGRQFRGGSIELALAQSVDEIAGEDDPLALPPGQVLFGEVVDATVHCFADLGTETAAAHGGFLFMDALEYGRIIHAEMSAIVDAARLGRAVKNSILFCTTFPCHMCAKHIVGAGIDKVYFLEPYPKSLVGDLHNDSICVEGNDRGNYSAYPAVIFEHFFGVAPRRYRELFERGSRKENGQFERWIHGAPMPNLNILIPLYASFEAMIAKEVIPKYINKSTFNPDKVLNT
jgi:deoxycytidylate deaminase